MMRLTVTPHSASVWLNRSWVIGPLRRDALQAHRDRVRLPRPDPDRQVAIVGRVAQDDDVLRGHHVHADALDNHLVQRAVAPPLSTVRGLPVDMPEFYSRSGRWPTAPGSCTIARCPTWPLGRLGCWAGIRSRSAAAALRGLLGGRSRARVGPRREQATGPDAPGDAVGAGAAVSGTWYRPSGRAQTQDGRLGDATVDDVHAGHVAEGRGPVGAARYCST